MASEATVVLKVIVATISTKAVVSTLCSINMMKDAAD
jgi:hypothetical protein